MTSTDDRRTPELGTLRNIARDLRGPSVRRRERARADMKRYGVTERECRDALAAWEREHGRTPVIGG